ncbi:alpha/beta hydrolase [Naumannella halotolerans]|uniref:alpha/beta hydrolase n=1 Tax=Naumannella halotolerans TaxID=993414 RepID=UPI00370DB469
MGIAGRIAAGTAVALGAGLAVAGAAAAQVISGPQRPRLPYGFTPYEVGVPSEDVSFASADGTPLHGWWFDQPGSEQVVICCHGHRGSKADLLGIAPGLWRTGRSVFVFDFRGSGESGDGPQSLAFREQDDLRAAIDLVAARRPDAEIVLFGFSMGAAVSILVGADDPRVGRFVLDSPFADMTDVIRTAVHRMRLPTFPLLPLTDLATGIRYRYRFDDVRPIDVIGKLSPRPLLLLHAEDDTIIPIDHAHRLLAAAGEPKELITYPGFDHCGGYFADRPAFIARVAEFLDR